MNANPNPSRYTWTDEEMFERFALLADLLNTHPLPCANGTTRSARASEFMLMHEAQDPCSGRVIGFKHHDSRNYVFVLLPTSGAMMLYVPKTSAAFMRGTFDVF